MESRLKRRGCPTMLPMFVLKENYFIILVNWGWGVARSKIGFLVARSLLSTPICSRRIKGCSIISQNSLTEVLLLVPISATGSFERHLENFSPLFPFCFSPFKWLHWRKVLPSTSPTETRELLLPEKGHLWLDGPTGPPQPHVAPDHLDGHGESTSGVW